MVLPPLIAAGGLLTLATGSIWLGSVLGSNKPEPRDEMSDETIDLTWLQVLIMPISSSFFLLLLFFYFAYVQLILVLFIVCGSAISCLDVLRSFIATFTPGLKGNVSSIFSIVFTIYMVVQWATTGSFIAHDVLGCSICISSIAMIRLPSLKLATVCLTLLLFYDIFWVFYSEYFFHKNVMVEVATKNAVNPLQSLGVTYQISILKQLQPTLQLPIKLLMPSSLLPESRVMMLGLGDIALPGFLVSLALRCDIYHSNKESFLPNNLPESQLLSDDKSRKSYMNQKSANLFEFAIMGYIFGLLLAFYIGSITGYAQPALIYLVPGVLIPIAVRAWHTSRLLEVWNGPSKQND